MLSTRAWSITSVVVLVVCFLTFHQRISTLSTLLSTYLLFPLSPLPIFDPSLYLPPSTSPLNSSSPQLSFDSELSPPIARVPKIIHQVLLGAGEGYTLRPAWEEARASCVELHPEWEFKLWTDADGDAFVRSEYGNEVFEMYRGYPQEIMRSNVLRYLVLAKHGGIYLDLDLKCRANLDMFLGESFVTPPAQPTGVNNAFIVARPNHPFFSYLISRLAEFNLPYPPSPYVTNMFSTGCQFFSTMHLFYPYRSEDHTSEGEERGMKVLPWEFRLNGHVENALFEHLGASSWHRGDAQLILRLGRSIEILKFYFPHLLAVSFLLALALYLLADIFRRVKVTPARPRKNSCYSACDSIPVAPTLLDRFMRFGGPYRERDARQTGGWEDKMPADGPCWGRDGKRVEGWRPEEVV